MKLNLSPPCPMTLQKMLAASSPVGDSRQVRRRRGGDGSSPQRRPSRGLSKPARDELRNQQLRVRVWEAADIVDAVLRTYDRLPEDIRTRLPFKRVWMLSDVGT